jgi:hypothetical protein
MGLQDGTIEVAAGLLPAEPSGVDRTRELQTHAEQPPHDFTARPDVAEDAIEGRERRFVKSVRLSRERTRHHDHLVLEFRCVAPRTRSKCS